MPPPKNPHERAKNIRFYWAKRVEYLVSEFDETKHRLRVLAKAAARDGCNPPGAAQIKELETLQAAIADAREQLQKAEKAVQDTVPGVQRQRAAEKQARQQAGREAIEMLDKFTV